MDTIAKVSKQHITNRNYRYQTPYEARMFDTYVVGGVGGGTQSSWYASSDTAHRQSQ
jgi:hypothetical protein